MKDSRFPWASKGSCSQMLLTMGSNNGRFQALYKPVKGLRFVALEDL
jgi:hypothetical protein